MTRFGRFTRFTRFARATRFACASSLVVLAPFAAQAQVGHTPANSPYEDLKPGQNLSLSAGWLVVRRDPANVAPKSGPLMALRYDIAIGGPASMYVGYAFAPSERRLLLPSNPRATRVIDNPKVTTHIADVGIDIALTGKKTWHHLSPSVIGGVGIASDFASADTGAYRLGTRFTFTYGLAMRYVMRNGLALRVDAINHTWQYQYPDRYFVKASDSTSVLTDSKKRSAYRGNWGLTAGVSLPLFR